MHPELKQQLYGGEISDYYKETLLKQTSKTVDQDFNDLYSVYKNQVSNKIKNKLPPGIEFYK